MSTSIHKMGTSIHKIKSKFKKFLRTQKQRRPSFQKYITTLEKIILLEEENFFEVKKKC